MKIFISIIVLFLAATVNAQETTTFILVRHSEKANDGTRNPPLSNAGKMRSQLLAQLLDQTQITAIYSTDLKRTIMTVEEIAEKKDQEILIYSWDDPKTLADELLKKNTGGTVLVSGHSNTTPFLANALLGEERFEQFDDNDYSNLLIISVDASGNGKLLHLTF